MCLNAVADMVTSVVTNDDLILLGSRKTLCMAIERNQTGNGRYGCDVTMYIHKCLLYVQNVFLYTVVPLTCFRYMFRERTI